MLGWALKLERAPTLDWALQSERTLQIARGRVPARAHLPWTEGRWLFPWRPAPRPVSVQ